MNETAYRLLPVDFVEHGQENAPGQPCPVSVRTPPHRWHYASLSSEIELEGRADEVLAVKIATTVNEGPIGMGLISAQNISHFIVPERILNRSPILQEIVFLVPARERFRVCVRTGDGDHSAQAQIMEVSWTQNQRLIKEVEVATFAHWYYTVDLGDGVIARATVQDEPGWTGANSVARAIFSHLLKEYVGSISGTKVLDVACSAGHFSFLFAGMGAHVRGFDHDPRAIEQARFVTRHIGKEWPGSANFSVADLENFATDEQYDIVFCSGLFYHLRDPIAGARKLKDLSSRWVLLQSCVSDRQDPVFELSDPRRWPFCADWEFCLVPSASMVRAIFEKLGLCLRACFRLGDFVFDETATFGDPIYMVLEKAD